ncbi:transcription activator GCR1-like domain-containing protein NDAI_0D01580 [Naumovozyma dairenensis CBS 421]|uniref:Transcription activator GCR1-like domain-containing protein n=1 Tax=Naumovozyma dairenensis (strain ATCC 10597 / BCRC 20456 / CBS 421 / NBRC 0211 / NRRL Y-12639) TaxID=1071378 RepID=G0W9L1_NAUDC|nr:hypothetical protein NDAI_0D01580 [Naumovozyma dairenensis CBS 421]CCD24472.1 hypothetical protein NDAI_0D01580 [Naumovozyma dairenensis CBS 421]
MSQLFSDSGFNQRMTEESRKKLDPLKTLELLIGKINKMSEIWEDFTRKSLDEEKVHNFTFQEKLKTLEEIFDLIQGQNASILIDVDLLSRNLLKSDIESNNIFEHNDEYIPSKVTSESRPTSHPYLTFDIDENNNLESDISNMELLEFPTKGFEDLNFPVSSPLENHNINVVSGPSLNCTDEEEDRDKFLNKKIQLAMAVKPNSITELFYEYENVLTPKVKDIQKKYGKKCLKQITNIRTLQRRKALVSEIKKFAKQNRKSIKETLEVAEYIRLKNNRSVPWLYNNISHLLDELKNDYL